LQGLFVGAGEDRWRHREAERLGGLQVYDQLDLGGLQDRQVACLLARENSARGVFASEVAALNFIRTRIARGATVYADEAGAWNELHGRFTMHGMAAARPELCTDAPGFDRVAFHKELGAEVLAFLRKHLAEVDKP